MSKGRRGGKYQLNNGYGTTRKLDKKEYGTKRKFIGSESSEYQFVDPKTGNTFTIVARSPEAALRRAKQLGYVEKRHRR